MNDAADSGCSFVSCVEQGLAPMLLAVVVHKPVVYPFSHLWLLLFAVDCICWATPFDRLVDNLVCCTYSLTRFTDMSSSRLCLHLVFVCCYVPCSKITGLRLLIAIVKYQVLLSLTSLVWWLGGVVKDSYISLYGMLFFFGSQSLVIHFRISYSFHARVTGE